MPFNHCRSPCIDLINTLSNIFSLGLGTEKLKVKPSFYRGTMLRLPLRISSEAKASVISRVDSAHPAFVMELLKRVEAFAEPAIVFGRSLECVSWSDARIASRSRDADATEPVTPVGGNTGSTTRGLSAGAGKQQSAVHEIQHSVVEIMSVRMINVTQGLRQQRSAPNRIPAWCSFFDRL
jgi:hypothetical protein